jgi:hypothetical protein
MQPYQQSPVAIGGIGGSGTGLIAEILSHLGYYMGSDLNQENDNLWFTLLFKRIEVLVATRQEFNYYLDLFLRRMMGMISFSPEDRLALGRLAVADRLQQDRQWLAARVDSFLSSCTKDTTSKRWGWKEPNTHIVIDRLNASLDSIRYIHVIRNGLDMAYSRNQNQLAYWGHVFLGLNAVPIDPRHALKYWCRVHKRILDIGQEMPGRFLLVNYDMLCRHPCHGLSEIAHFLGENLNTAQEKHLQGLISSPSSIGRFRTNGLQFFDKDDLAFVESLGFPLQ